jgi:hypothetical protein
MIRGEPMDTVRRTPRLGVANIGGPLTCDACGGRIALGGRCVVYDTPPVIMHDRRDGCPPRWRPVADDGGACERGSPRLPMLDVIDGDEWLARRRTRRLPRRGR